MATGLSVADNYYAQPLLAEIARSLHVSPTAAGLIITVSQAGYAVGLLFVLPLGDLLERRTLAVVLSLGAAAALLWVGFSPSLAVLLPGALVLGTMSALAQVLVALSASLASPEERGRVVGLVMSGLLVGLLLARTVSGLLSETGTWRAVYVVAAGAMAVLAGVLGLRLPPGRDGGRIGYLAAIVSVGRLFFAEPVLRLRAAYGLLSFATFSCFWTSMAFLLARHYHYSSAVIGLFGLTGAAGALAATAAGRLSDGGHERLSTLVTSLLCAGSWVFLSLGRNDIALLVVGIVVLDLGVQGIHITNQGEIYRLAPNARSRVNSAYMVCYFVGGGIGSALSASLDGRYGWNAVCVVGAGFGIACVVLALVHPGGAGAAPGLRAGRAR